MYSSCKNINNKKYTHRYFFEQNVTKLKGNTEKKKPPPLNIY